MRRVSAVRRLFGLFVCLAVGLGSFGLGAVSLAKLSSSFQPEDILYDEGPGLFQAWLIRHHKSGDLTPAAVSQRILFMPIAARRSTVNAMMGRDFWAAIGGPEAKRRTMLTTIENGLVGALAKAPSAGDLWLAASKIRSQTSGFDHRAANYLAASYLMSPREGSLVRSRIVFAASVEPMLRMPLAEERERDMVIARELYPGFERKVQNWLDARERERADTKRKVRTRVR